MKKSKKLIALLLAAVMIIGLLAACSGEKPTNTDGESQQTQQGNTDPNADATTPAKVGDGKAPAGSLIVAAAGNVQAIDPFSSSTIGQIQYRGLIYMKLGYYGADGFESDALVSWDITDTDGFERLLVIEPGIYDSEGNTFTADDLIFCFDKILEIGKINNVTSNLASYEKAGDLEVKIRLTQNTITGYTEMANSTLLCTKAAYEASSDGMATDKPVGFTQYKVTNFVSSSYVELEKVQDYWQKDESKISDAYKANIDYIRVNMINETSQKISGMQTGDLQLVKDLAAANLTQLPSPQFTAHYRNAFNTDVCVAFNMLNGNCKDDLKLRQAICTALNSEDMLAAMGTGGYVLNSIIPPTYEGYNTEWDNEDYYNYDVAKAKELLAESNYDGKTPIRILVASNDANKRTGEIMVGNLQEAGIVPELVVRETTAWSSAQYAASGEYDLMIYGAGSNAYNAYDAFHKICSDDLNSTEGETQWGYSEPTFMERGEAVSIIGNDTPENLNWLHDYLKDNALVYGLYVQRAVDVTSADITRICMYSNVAYLGACDFTPTYSVKK